MSLAYVLSTFYMQQSVVGLLALLTSINGLALFHKVISTEAIHAKVVGLQSRYLCVMIHIFKARACTQWMLIWFAQNTLVSLHRSMGHIRSYVLGMPFELVCLMFQFLVLSSLSTEIQKI